MNKVKKDFNLLYRLKRKESIKLTESEWEVLKEDMAKKTEKKGIFTKKDPKK